MGDIHEDVDTSAFMFSARLADLDSGLNQGHCIRDILQVDLFTTRICINTSCQGFLDSILHFFNI